jgi:type IV pilus assembly protein PilC
MNFVVVLKRKKTGVLGFFQELNQAVVGLSKIKLREKVTFFQLLAVMINAGVPIIRSLYVLSDQANNPRFKNVIRHLAKQMEQGMTLSDSMNDYPNVFKQAERGMIASGEASGNLNSILKDLAANAEKAAYISSKVKGAMIYPAAITMIMLVALGLILTLVVPKLTEFFDSAGQQLPLVTRILVGTSEWAQSNWYFVLAAVIALIAGMSFLSRTKNGKYQIDRALLYMPVFGKILRQLMVARFARMLASLIDAGIPIVKGLEINANAVGNAVYKRRINFASQDVAQGIQLGDNLTGNAFLFPPMVASMILVGEQTANLNEVANKLAEYYESEVDNKVAALSKLLEPLIVVVMGSIVAFIVAAVMLPIIGLSDLASSI